MRVLVACEFSGVVRDAFIEARHDAMSCDLLPTESPGPHYQGDVLDLLEPHHFDLMIAHPPCTNLTRSGARWWSGRKEAQARDIEFVRTLLNAPFQHVCIENPPGLVGTALRPADQYIQPWQFGHGEVKSIGLWLRALPRLIPTDIVDGREPRIHYAAPGPDRWKVRSRFYPGIAKAMAAQWGEIKASYQMEMGFL